MTEPRRPSRRRTQAVADQSSAEGVDLNPYRDDDAGVVAATTATVPAPPSDVEPDRAEPADAAGDGEPVRRTRPPRPARRPRAARAASDGDAPAASTAATETTSNTTPNTTPETARDTARDAEPVPPRSTAEPAEPIVRPAPEPTPYADTAVSEVPNVAPSTPPFVARPQPDGSGRPHARHEGRHEGRRDNRHEGRNARHERFDRSHQDRPTNDRGINDRPPHDRSARAPFPERANGAHGPSQGGADASGGPGRRGEFFEGGGRRQRQRQRGRFRDGATPPNGDFRDQQSPQQPAQPQRPVPALIADTEVTGWVELARDGSGFVRQAANSYLVGPNDPFIPVGVVRANNLRAGDGVLVGAGRDFRQRPVVVEVRTVNGAPPQPGIKRPDFQSLLATYPDRKLTLETGKVAKSGPELTRRIIDLIAPIGFGQRALIVAPARSGKTILLQNIVEGVALNHPTAELILLLVDERPEEVSEMVACGYGEVVASSFDMPADRHRDVVTMVMHRAQRLVEAGKDVVIVLDSITRMARAFNATKGVGRTLSGGLDAQAMATPKAFFGSARSVAATHGGGSITIIGTALVETGSRMDDVIFEEFKGTGNCEIKLDRNLAEQRIFPAIDVPASGTRREDKLFRPEQLDAVYLLRRGLQSMPASGAMNWLTKRIANTPNNDTLLATLKDG